jgi:uncharacterized membrane protein YfcA
MEHYLLYGLVTLIFSTFFAMGGVGSAVALVSIFPMMGMEFTLAKTLALFVNTSSMISTSVMNFKRGVLDWRFAMPLVLSLLVATPLGAWSSQFVDPAWSRLLLAVFLLVSATMLIVGKPKPRSAKSNHRGLMVLIGLGVGVISGMIGVGGGALIMPLLILLGFDPKKAAYTVSFVIPFSTLGSFLTYLQFVHLDYILLLVVAVAAVIGGYLGGRIMHYRLSQDHVRKLIAVLLLVMAVKIILANAGALFH